MFNFLKRYFFAERFKGRKYVVGGLLKHKEDERDYGFGLFHGLFGGYQPKSIVCDIQTLSVKDQGIFNDCTWNAYAVQREIDEEKILSTRSIVCYGKSVGYLSGNGFADLRSNQRAGLEFGIAEQSLLLDNDQRWEIYSNPKLLTDAIKANAALHKDKSFFLVKSKDEWFKALDEGHIIHTGGNWFSSYNVSGGLTSPWILPWRRGTLVGGHAFACRGYDLQRGLLKFQNSYGADWGDHGCFYIRINDWFGSENIGYVSMKMDQDALTNFLLSFEGKQVKGAGPAIFCIQNGQKRVFEDEITFYAFGGRFGENGSEKTWTAISDSLLSKVPDGLKMNIEESTFWPLLKDNWQTLKWLKSPEKFQQIDLLIQSGK